MDELDIFDPFKKIRKQENLSRFFDSFPSFSGFDSIKTPLIDVSDEKNRIKITAELPGLKKEDLIIDVTESELILKGKMNLNKEKKDLEKGYFFREKKSNSCFRSIPLPLNVIPNKAKANFKDGILELTLPKKHIKKSKSLKKEKVFL